MEFSVRNSNQPTKERPKHLTPPSSDPPGTHEANDFQDGCLEKNLGESLDVHVRNLLFVYPQLLGPRRGP